MSSVACHAWIAELEIVDNTDVALRDIVDDSVHVLIRTQHVFGLAGNVFTSGLKEALFDIHITKAHALPQLPPWHPCCWCVIQHLYEFISKAGRTNTIDGPPFHTLALINYAEWPFPANRSRTMTCVSPTSSGLPSTSTSNEIFRTGMKARMFGTARRHGSSFQIDLHHR